MPGARFENSIKNKPLYEKLIAQGKSKEMAAKIANSRPIEPVAKKSAAKKSSAKKASGKKSTTRAKQPTSKSRARAAPTKTKSRSSSASSKKTSR